MYCIVFYWKWNGLTQKHKDTQNMKKKIIITSYSNAGLEFSEGLTQNKIMRCSFLTTLWKRKWEQHGFPISARWEEEKSKVHAQGTSNTFT